MNRPSRRDDPVAANALALPTISRRTFGLTALAASAIGCTHSPASTSADPAEDARVRAALTDWVEVRKQTIGVSLCVSDTSGIRTWSHGVLGLSDPRPVTADTVFPIASITKVFTGLLLSEAVLRGEMKLSDPARLHLPASRKLPTYKGQEITILNLVHQTTGLPQEIPDYLDAPGRIGADPLAPLYDFLATAQLPDTFGKEWAYSNLNYDILGDAIAHAGGLSYADLLAKRITRPLGLHKTTMTMAPGTLGYRASPHQDVTTPTFESNKPWAPMLQSTVADLGVFLSAAMGVRRTNLAPAFDAMLRTTRSAPFLGGDQSLGWVIDTVSPEPRIFFAGRNPGFTSSIMYNPKTQRGVAALCNTYLMVEPLAREILEPGYLAAAEAALKAPPGGLPADPVLDRIAGRYALQQKLVDARMEVGEIISFERTPAGLTVILPRYPRVAVKQTGPDTWVINGFPVTFEFAAGPGVAMTMTAIIAGETARTTRQ
jgi:CubicO group peptidase (beta-lactamase class C family)